MRAEIAVFVLTLSDIIFLRTALHRLAQSRAEMTCSSIRLALHAIEPQPSPISS